MYASEHLEKKSLKSNENGDFNFNDKNSSKKSGIDDSTPPGSNFDVNENEGMCETPVPIEDSQSKTINEKEDGEEDEEQQQQNNTNGRNNDSDDDSDDDNDNVKIVIDFNRPSAQTNSSILNRQISKPTSAGTTGPTQTTNIPITAANMQASAAVKATQAKGIDLDAPGVINDAPTYDYDLEGVRDEDKPWRKPGADITDYFNYGFTEETWIGYCMKQKRLRQENINFKVSFCFIKEMQRKLFLALIHPIQFLHLD